MMIENLAIGSQVARSGSSFQLYSRSDVDRARIYADSVARSAVTLEHTLTVAEQSLVVGLGAIARGELTAGGHHLSRALIATGLAAWQLQQLGTEANNRRDFEASNERRSSAEAQLYGLPGRVRIAANALYGTGNGAQVLAELRGALLAFVLGSRVWQTSLPESAQSQWLRSLQAAFERESAINRRSDVSTLGVPALAPQARLAEPRRAGRRDGRPTLSNREREVLNLIVAGLTTQEIAYQLGVKATTISTLVGRIFNKLGVNNRPAAVATALRGGLCGTDDLAA